MPNHLKFCRCAACKAGRHRPTSKAIVKRASRKLRQQTKQALKTDREPPSKGTVSYTD